MTDKKLIKIQKKLIDKILWVLEFEHMDMRERTIEELSEENEEFMEVLKDFKKEV